MSDLYTSNIPATSARATSGMPQPNLRSGVDPEAVRLKKNLLALANRRVDAALRVDAISEEEAHTILRLAQAYMTVCTPKGRR